VTFKLLGPTISRGFERSRLKHIVLFSCFFLVSSSFKPAWCQQSANVTNNAAPSANVSTNANGGTQINQQLNNVFDTSFGFGPGIICKTPQLLFNAATGSNNSYLDVLASETGNYQGSQTFTGSISLAIPLGSSVIKDCQKFAAQIASDRVLSSELSLIRACAQLEKEKLVIDPIKYPNLAKCIPANQKISSSSLSASPPNALLPTAMPNATQAPVIQRFNP
jgi:hypothetical protein